MPALTVAQIAKICAGAVEGDEQRLITRANALDRATETEVSFAANKKAIETASSSRAGCLLVPIDFDQSGSWSLIRVAEPRRAFTKILDVLYPKKKRGAGVHRTAIVSDTAKLGPDCFIEAYVTIGEDAVVGSGCVIGTGCVIGDRVSIGDHTTLHARVTIYDDVRIGSRVILHSGCVIGADGFGFTLEGDHYEKFPQVGTVEIGDDVEMGASCCVDRAALGITRIGEGSKFDNLVHVAHNCEIGRHVIVAAQAGFSGSVVVGDYAMIGGQVGIGEKAKIESRAIVGGKAGILTGQTVLAGEPVWGIPARPLRQHLKGLAHVAKLPELREHVKELKRAIAALERRHR